jgi:hypothetical protein
MSRKGLSYGIRPRHSTEVPASSAFSTESAGRRGKNRRALQPTRSPEIWDLNIVDDQKLSVTFDYVTLTNVDTITLKDATGKITAEIE